ncbi:hypothetical protein [uncultured Sphingomonas sp.]|uniref:hypothetical protein n=1 Tax=uncultured Sphingomonas sp. TaxID=158754 RepID=UPI0035CB42AC
MRTLVMLAALMSAGMTPGAVSAQSDAQAETGQPPQRIRSVSITAGERCPPSTDTEVIVCYQGGNPYRIPPGLRESAPSAANQSWVNRAANIDQVSRVAGGLPDTCSPIGTGGQSGCALAANRAYAADKRQRELDERLAPGGDDD